jgi:hypothetical protein
VEVVHKSIVGFQSNIDTAKEHRIKPILVSQLVSKLKKNPKAFEEVRQRQAEVECINQRIKAATQHYIDRSQHIWNAQQIQDKVKEESRVEVNILNVRKVLRSSFGLRYKKV